MAKKPLKELKKRADKKIMCKKKGGGVNCLKRWLFCEEINGLEFRFKYCWWLSKISCSTYLVGSI